MSELSLQCPHCEHDHDDPFEIIEGGVVDSMACHLCRKPFWFLLVECQRCAGEYALSWVSEPSGDVVNLTTCRVCFEPTQVHDAWTEQHGSDSH